MILKMSARLEGFRMLALGSQLYISVVQLSGSTMAGIKRLFRSFGSAPMSRNAFRGGPYIVSI